MHIIIKGNYLNLDDVLVVSAIEKSGEHGAMIFRITYKNGKNFEFYYNSTFKKDVETENGNFYFGTDCFFYNAHKEILNTLTNAA